GRQKNPRVGSEKEGDYAPTDLFHPVALPRCHRSVTDPCTGCATRRCWWRAVLGAGRRRPTIASKFVTACGHGASPDSPGGPIKSRLCPDRCRAPTSHRCPSRADGHGTCGHRSSSRIAPNVWGTRRPHGGGADGPTSPAIIQRTGV